MWAEQEDFYRDVERVLDDDEISAAEEGFMRGYMEDLEDEDIP